MKDLIIAIEKRVEELAAQSWNVGADARDVILAEIKWLETLLPKLENAVAAIGEADDAGLFDLKTSNLASINSKHRQAMRSLIRDNRPAEDCCKTGGCLCSTTQ